MKLKVHYIYDDFTAHLQGTAEQLAEQLRQKFDWLKGSSLTDLVAELNRAQAFSVEVEQ